VRTRVLRRSVGRPVLPAAFLTLLTGCGYIGPIQPPVLDIPQRVTDLRAGEFGDKIVSDFTIPALTTEGLVLKSVRSVEIFAGVAPNPFSDAAYLATAKRYPVPASGPGPLTREIPIAEWIGKTVMLRVRATGPKGKTSDWSNFVSLTIDPALAQPADLKAENLPTGIGVTWNGSAGAHYHVYRATGAESPALLDSVNDPHYLDTTVEFGASYRYFVEAFEGTFQHSDTAGTQPVVRADLFPPSVPAGLTAEPGTNSIELSWERNTDAGFQGYNIYRSVDGGAFEKIASLIVAPAYSDRMVEAGKRYRYQISSMGTNGLESARSAAQEITAQ
jgi:hypothetical protein